GGRRIDGPGADAPRFPSQNVALVRRRVADALVAERAAAPVSSAACGADLVALEKAEHLGVRRRIVLLFAPKRFRVTSLVDRPGEWGPVFDRPAAHAAVLWSCTGSRTSCGGPRAYDKKPSILRSSSALAKRR